MEIMCRACLSTGRRMVIMDEIFIQNYNVLTNLNLTLTENVSLFICTKCYEGANFCIEFRNKCIASDLTLKKKLFPVQIEKHEDDEDENVVTIKKDLKLEYEDDDECIRDYSMDFQLFETEDVKVNIPIAENNEDNSKVGLAKAVDKKVCISEAKDDKVCIVRKKSTKKESSIRKNTNEKMVKPELNCKICPKSFVDEEGLRNHLDSHTLQKPCVLCGELFMNLPHLLSHRIEHLPEKQKRCHRCFKKYLKAPCLEFHYMRIHELAEKDSPIQCKNCPASFDNGKKLLRHVEDSHSVIKFTCDDCGLGIRSKKQLRYHMISHQQLKRYECDLCDYTSKYPSGVGDHKLRKHTIDRIHCKICGRLFKSQYLMDVHKCMSVMAKICPVCGKTFKSSSAHSLKRHLQTHEDVYPYKCDICQAKFKTRNCYQTHMDKHNGTPPKHRCEFCQRSFYFANVLIKHRRTHTGEKPYVCSVCNRGFTGNHNLKVHMKVHGVMNLITKKDSTT